MRRTRIMKRIPIEHSFHAQKTASLFVVGIVFHSRKNGAKWFFSQSEIKVAYV